MRILNATITTAGTSVGPVYQLRGGSSNVELTVSANFTHGTGGTSVDAYIQTSMDGGTTWVDIAEFSFATSTSTALYNLSSGTPVTSPVTPTDGGLTANTSVNGLLGNLFRVKTIVVGTYSGTSLVVNAISAGGLTAQ